MNLKAFKFSLLLFISQVNVMRSQTALPTPDHIVIAILESHGYSQLIGSSAAPYINSLSNDTLSALFAESYAVAHPSQPNYLVLFSGSIQGVTDNLVPSDNPFTAANLIRQLIDSGKTFISYCEDLPEVGYNGATSGYYARKHNPVTNWMGTGTNQVSTNLNQPFTAFPINDFSLLPTVCYVVPNLENDMHNGSDPARITIGDEWISNNLNSYIQWAKANNSLFILTFDEEGSTVANHIITIFTGQMVKSGQYSNKINHYSVLHTIEKMYGLPYVGDSLTYTPITYCWKENSSTSISTTSILNDIIYPNPTKGLLIVELLNYKDATAEIYNVDGQLIQNISLASSQTTIKTDGLISGLYLVKIKSKEGVIQRKIIKN
jgi:phosphatidylinositol-3-phosphatase